MILKAKSTHTGRYIAYSIAEDRVPGIDGEALRRYGVHLGYEDENGVWRDKYHEPLSTSRQGLCSGAKVVE